MSLFLCVNPEGGSACEHCGTALPTSKGPGRRRQYCSRPCKNRAKYLRRNPCWSSPFQQATCEHCGTSFAPRRNSQRYCSRKCHDRARSGRPVTESCACGSPTTRTRRSSLRRAPKCQDCRRDDRVAGQCSLVPWAQCLTCDRWHVDRRKVGYCSSACKSATPKDPSGSCRVHYGDCAQCGRVFCSRRANRKFCSEGCGKKSRKSIRRHRERAAGYRKRKGHDCDDVGYETFTTRQIAERDGWRCHLCGKRVLDREWRGRPGDAELDHLTPLSAGGDHTRQNVALSHRSCNGRRSDKGPAQMRLFG